VSGLPDVDIETMAQLREINLGDWDGKGMENIRTRFPDAWQERGRHIDTFRTPGGESFQDLHERVIPVLEEIALKAREDVLVVAHAGVNRIILCHVMEKPIQELFSIPQDYAALNLIEYQGGRPLVSAINRTPPRSAF
jgi:alpha-ribazole phosphatase